MFFSFVFASFVVVVVVVIVEVVRETDTFYKYTRISGSKSSAHMMFNPFHMQVHKQNDDIPPDAQQTSKKTKK